MNKWILVLLSLASIAHAGQPVWTFRPLTPTSISVSANGTGSIQYTVTNQSRKTHTLAMNKIQGITQDISGTLCENPFILGYQQSCTLKLDITGSQLTRNVNGGPQVCELGGQGLQCYQPGQSNQLNITLAPAVILTGISPNTSSTSGGRGVTLTGTGLTGTTSVKFDSTDAISFNVVNSTTVTAVTPAHSAGPVDVVLTTPLSTATLVGSFTYETTAVGQSAYGGTIACLNGASNNLIAATADNSTGIIWGGYGTPIYATSDTDGETNTATIVSVLGDNGGISYAAKLCSDYEIDSQGNNPCQAGNTCYNDWFLPAGNNTNPSGQLNCLYTNKAAIGGFASLNYWSSTEDSNFGAFIQVFDNSGFQRSSRRDRSSNRVRCVRAFTPYP